MINILENKKNKILIYFLLVLLIGVFLRVILAQLKWNMDTHAAYFVLNNFEIRDLYKSQYNYTPIWYYVLLFLNNLSDYFYLEDLIIKTLKLCEPCGPPVAEWGFYEDVYPLRIKMLSFLFIFDLLTFLALFKFFNIKVAAVFFLNPIAMIISANHGQIDNWVMFFVLISIILFTQKQKKFSKIFSSVFLGLSLTIKHIFIFFPFWIYFKEKNNLNKLLLPVLIYFIFILSFSFYIFTDFENVIKNMFLYKSFNNYPLYSFFGLRSILGSKAPFYIFLLIMMLLGYLFRKKSYPELICIYSIAIIAFSSAIANQYLTICSVAIALNYKNIFFKLYIFFGTLFLFNNADGLNLLHLNWMSKIINYDLLAFLLFLGLIRMITNPEKSFTKKIYNLS